jgi:shikimate dehydrogenase
MHHAALAALARDDGRFADWRYFRFDVPPADLPRALERLHACRFHGLNLTIPHKVIACGCTAAIDADARQAGAVNTLRWAQEGWHGFNTDGYGLTRGVREDLGRDIAGSSVVLLGAGGAARGAAVECLARGCAELWLVNRTKVNLDRLLEILGPIAGKIPVRGWDRSRAPAGPKAGFILVNATSAGLRPGDPPPIDLAALPRPAGVLDMNYNPPRTALLRQAESLGIPCANGLSMLVNQGAKALEIWTGIPADRTAPIMMAAAREALAGGGPSD